MPRPAAVSAGILDQGRRRTKFGVLILVLICGVDQESTSTILREQVYSDPSERRFRSAKFADCHIRHRDGESSNLGF
jgi:hypothetical protein